MSGILWRVLIAVVACVIAFALIPPVLRVIGLDVSGDLMLIIKVCIAGLAVFYILRGPSMPFRS